MNPREVAHRYWEAVRNRDWPRAWACLHPRFRAIWPVTRECFDRATFIRVNEEYPAPDWQLQVERLEVLGEEVVSVVCVTDGPRWFFCTAFFSFADGQIIAATEYWADGAEPPGWRRGWSSSA